MEENTESKDRKHGKENSMKSKVTIWFNDDTSVSFTSEEPEPMWDDGSTSKIETINKLLDRAGKDWKDIKRIKENHK